MIAPEPATQPRALLLSWCAALSEGDVEAAWSRYAHDAVLVPWHLPAVRGAQLRSALSWVAELRLPVRVLDVRSADADDLAVIRGSWSVSGRDGDGRPVALAADVVALAHRERRPGRPDCWLTDLERWTDPVEMRV